MNKRILILISMLISLPICSHAKTIKTQSMDEYIYLSTQLINNAENKSADRFFSIFEKNEFESCRLLLLSDDEISDNSADTVISSPDGQYILFYPTEEETEAAYNKYISLGMTVIPDVSFYVDSQKDTSLYISASHISYGPDFIHSDEFNDLLIEKYGAVENMPEIRIGVIDTGVNYDHELLKDRVDISSGYDFANNDSDPIDDHGHGSHVSGIIADSTLDNVIIVPYKTITSTGKGSVSFTVNAINKAISDGNIDILNLSLGSEDLSHSLKKYFTVYFKRAYNSGILSVAAGGNDSSDADYSCPANIAQYTIAISACNSAGTFASGYSNYGSVIDFCAPGSSIYSSLHTSSSAYGYKSGTSMAAPFASSAFAMLKTYYPDHTVSELEETMREFSTDGGETGYDKYYGYGYISMENLASQLSCTSAPSDTPRPSEEPESSSSPMPDQTSSPAPTVSPTPIPEQTASPIPEPSSSPTAAPPYSPTPTATVSSEPRFTVCLNGNDIPIYTENESIVVASAIYDDNGIMTSLTLYDVSSSCDINTGDYTKIFIFDSTSSLMPLHDLIEREN